MRSVLQHWGLVMQVVAQSSGVGFKDIPGKGRGVVALRAFAPGECVEEVPMIIVPKKDLPERLSGTVFDQYLLFWSQEPGKEFAITGGLLMFYNHSTRPNVKLRDSDTRSDTFVVEALGHIAPGDELTFDYNCELGFQPL